MTLTDVFSCEPQNQQHLIDAWIRATEDTLGKLPGIISASLHRSKDGTRVVNYANGRLVRTGKTSWASTSSPTLTFTTFATS